jgi:exodeoxyribonuclease VII large subunit
MGITLQGWARFRPLLAQLEALSPLAILGRGYAIVWRMPGRTLIRNAAQLAAGDTISVTLGKGGATAIVKTVEE